METKELKPVSEKSKQAFLAFVAVIGASAVLQNTFVVVIAAIFAIMILNQDDILKLIQKGESKDGKENK